MAVSADEAMSQILGWVNNGNSMPDDNENDDNDLDDLYGEDTVVRVPDCHFDEEDGNLQSDTETVTKMHRILRKP